MTSLVQTILFPLLMITFGFRVLFLLGAAICVVGQIMVHTGLWQAVVFFVLAWLCTAIGNAARRVAYSVR